MNEAQRVVCFLSFSHWVVWVLVLFSFFFFSSFLTCQTPFRHTIVELDQKGQKKFHIG